MFMYMLQIQIILLEKSLILLKCIFSIFPDKLAAVVLTNDCIPHTTIG